MLPIIKAKVMTNSEQHEKLKQKKRRYRTLYLRTEWILFKVNLKNLFRKYLLLFPFYSGTFASLYIYTNIYKTISIPTYGLIVAVFIYLLLFIRNRFLYIRINDKTVRTIWNLLRYIYFFFLVFSFLLKINITDKIAFDPLFIAIGCMTASGIYLLIFMVRLGYGRSRSLRRPILELIGSVYLCLLAFGFYYASIGLNPTNSIQSSLFMFLNTNHLLDLQDLPKYIAVPLYVFAIETLLGYLHFALFIGILFQYSSKNKQ